MTSLKRTLDVMGKSTGERTLRLTAMGIGSRRFRIRGGLGLILFSLFSLAIFLAYHSVSPKYGLVGEYYTNPELAGSPVITARDRAINLRRARTFLAENYSIQWSGMIYIPVAGEYQFSTTSDDGSALYLDNRMVVDNLGFHGLQERTGTILLEKGFFPIRVQYVQGNGSTALRVYWKRPGKPRALLSQDYLFSEEPDETPLWVEQTLAITWQIIKWVWLGGMLVSILIGLWNSQRLFVFLGASPQRVMSTLKSVAQRILLIGLSFLFCLLLGLPSLEFLLRTGWFDDKGTVWIPEKYKILNDEINRRNQQFAEKNPYHFTDEVREKDKPDGWYRIAILGDSFVWSDGLPYDQGWSHKLEQKIVQQYDKIEVMSWGLRGWATVEQFNFLKKHGIQYDPDLLIIGFVINDPDMGHYKKKVLNWPDPSAWYTRGLMKPLRKIFPNVLDFLSVYITTFLTDFVLEGYGYKYWHEQLYSQENLQRYVVLLTELSTYCKSHNIRLLFVLTPSTHEEFKQQRFEQIMPLLEQADIEYVNLYPVIAREFQQYKPRELWANPANPHPGPLVTEVYANEVFDYLIKNAFLIPKTS